MRADDELGGVADLSREGFDISLSPVDFLRDGYVVRSHDVATADQESRPATPGLRVNEHADRPEYRETAVALLATILDERVGHRHFCDEPKGNARSGGERRARNHERAAAILSSTMRVLRSCFP
jgi:hypothetical protein